MNTANRVSLSIEDQVARVELARPEKHNALDLEMFSAIVETQNKIARNRNIRVVILSGSGIDFCTGLDVKSLMKDRAGMLKLLWKWSPWRANLAQKVCIGWRKLQVPVIATVQGRCWGGGLQIAMGADFRFVSPTASLSVMEGKWGLIPDMGGTLAMRELTRIDQALLLSMSAGEISGERALELGLATELSDDPLTRANQLAGQLIERSPDALAAVKRLYYKSWKAGSGWALARESAYQVRILSGPNQRIAVRKQFGDKKAFRQARRW